MSNNIDPVQLFETVIGKDPEAFLKEPVYQVTESEVREFARQIVGPVLDRQPVIYMHMDELDLFTSENVSGGVAAVSKYSGEDMTALYIDPPELAELQAEFEAGQANWVAGMETIKELQATITRLTAENEANRTEREIVCANYDELKAENEDLKAEDEEMQLELKRVQYQSNQHFYRVKALEEEVERLKKVTSFSEAVACVFDYLKFAAANTSDKSWDDQLEDLAKEVIEYSPEYKKQWKDICKLEADLRSANADKEAYGQNAIDLRRKLGEALDFIKRWSEDNDYSYSEDFQSRMMAFKNQI